MLSFFVCAVLGVVYPFFLYIFLHHYPEPSHVQFLAGYGYVFKNFKAATAFFASSDNFFFLFAFSLSLFSFLFSENEQKKKYITRNTRNYRKTFLIRFSSCRSKVVSIDGELVFDWIPSPIKSIECGKERIKKKREKYKRNTQKKIINKQKEHQADRMKKKVWHNKVERMNKGDIEESILFYNNDANKFTMTKRKITKKKND